MDCDDLFAIIAVAPCVVLNGSDCPWLLHYIGDRLMAASFDDRVGADGVGSIVPCRAPSFQWASVRCFAGAVAQGRT